MCNNLAQGCSVEKSRVLGIVLDNLMTETEMIHPESVKDKSKLYSLPVLDFYDSCILKESGFLLDYNKLHKDISGLLGGRDTSKMKIDDLPIDTHMYHPLAVIKAAKDYGFIISECTGPVNLGPDYPRLCNRFKANGIWLGLPGELEHDIKDYVRSPDKVSHSLCDVCGDVIKFKFRNSL